MPPGTSTAAVATDHARDLDRLAAEIADLSRPPGPADAETATRLASCRVNRASLSGDVSEMRRAAESVDAALTRFGPWADLCFLRAGVHLKQHRLAEAVASLARADGLAGSSDGRAIRADADLQLGRYREARRAYERLVAETRSWDALARLAHFEQMLGDPERADALFTEAADEITAKELRSYAWVETHWGLLHQRHGRLDEAELHHERARAAYSGHWLVERHLAELRAAQGQVDEAIGLCEDAAERTARPELAHAAGDLRRRAGDAVEARAWHDRALAGYLESVRLGEVQYHHHLVEYHADVAGDGAVQRPGQRRHEAVDMARRALASGVRDPRVLGRISAIDDSLHVHR